MSRLFSLAAALSFIAHGVSADDSDLIGNCFSYGMDFQGGGEYFQNVNSQDPFTFVQEFEGCQNDNATNVLVDPNGDQDICTPTPMQPDDADQLSTCPILKSQLWSGAWSILIMSNNGKSGAPIAYQRDFQLDVGPQITTTVTPTITITSTITPIVNVTTTTVNTETTTLPTPTTTVPSMTLQKTKTVIPPAVTTTKSINLATITIPKVSVSVTKIVKTTTASCHLPRRQPTIDPWIQIWPTIPAAQSIVASAASVAGVAAPTETAPPSAKFRVVRDPLGALEANREKWLQERAERLQGAAGMAKRAPDAQPLTVTEQSTSNWVTSTAVATTTPVTNTVVATTTTTTTITPAAITVMSGKTYLPPATTTLPTQTKTRTIFGVAKVTTTRVQTFSVTITTTVSSAPSKTACRRQGGIYW
ncbi:hypothetical protein GTA08_BOTSDO09460 [Neofusicoccum parvum]|nr:hypothetical protein GTA08_BOTSDO09460 [Neofusicoccum parvum]